MHFVVSRWMKIRERLAWKSAELSWRLYKGPQNQLLVSVFSKPFTEKHKITMFCSSLKVAARSPLFLFLMWVVLVAVYKEAPGNYGLCMQFLFFLTWILFLLTWILWEVHVKYSTGSPGIPRDPVECLERGPDQPGDITYPTYSVVWFGPDHWRSPIYILLYLCIIILFYYYSNYIS